MPSKPEVKRSRYHIRLAEGLCPLCGRGKEDPSYRLCASCREKARVLAVLRREGKAPVTSSTKLRLRLIEVYGGKCVRCGFLDGRALQLDHIQGDGYKEKADKNYYRFLKRVTDNPDFERFQLLCANCNWIKRHENNENPHLNRPKNNYPGVA